MHVWKNYTCNEKKGQQKSGDRGVIAGKHFLL